MEGAPVVETGGLGARWRDSFDYALKENDIILSVSGEPFESSKPLHSFLKERQRAYVVRVRRMVVPPRSALSARILGGIVAAMSSGGMDKDPVTQEDMERALLEFEYYRPRVAHPEDEEREDRRSLDKEGLSGWADVAAEIS